jgi:hypothetical protein
MSKNPAKNHLQASELHLHDTSMVSATIASILRVGEEMDSCSAITSGTRGSSSYGRTISSSWKLLLLLLLRYIDSSVAVYL